MWNKTDRLRWWFITNFNHKVSSIGNWNFETYKANLMMWKKWICKIGDISSYLTFVYSMIRLVTVRVIRKSNRLIEATPFPMLNFLCPLTLLFVLLLTSKYSSLHPIDTKSTRLPSNKLVCPILWTSSNQPTSAKLYSFVKYEIKFQLTEKITSSQVTKCKLPQHRAPSLNVYILNRLMPPGNLFPIL